MKTTGKTKGAMRWVQQQMEDPKRRQAIEELLAEMRLEQDLIALREAEGVSQRELARRAGVAQPMIARIESGRVRNLKMGTIARIATALNVRPRIVFDRFAGGRRKVIPLKRAAAH